MELRVFIVDDEIDNISIMKHFIQNYTSMKVIGFSQEVGESIDQINKLQPDIVFLDVELGGDETGFDISYGLSISCLIVFVTAHLKYSIQALRDKAFDYLLKPVDIDDLRSVEVNATKTLNTKIDTTINNDKIIIQSLERIDILDQNEIVYINSSGKYSEFFMQNGDSIVSSMNLGFYETKLNDNFLRVHNSYILNRSFVSYIDKRDGLTCVTRSGERIPISRRRKEEFFNEL